MSHAYSEVGVALTCCSIDSDLRNVPTFEALPTTSRPHHDLCTLRGLAGSILVVCSDSEVIGGVREEALDHEVSAGLLNDLLPLLKSLLEHLNL